MSELTRTINNYMALNQKEYLTEEEALEILKYVNDNKNEKREELNED